MITTVMNKHEFYPKIQPRSSSERDNSRLLYSVLTSMDNTNDIKKRLLNYASLDKLDCEASCILIALSNHEPRLDSKINHDTPSNTTNLHLKQRPQVLNKKNDPMMLLMAAAEVVNHQSDDHPHKKKRIHASTWKYQSKDTPVYIPPNNSFSRQYHSMKQNPKIKQNALHTYITYMIYNDLAQQGGYPKQQQTNHSNEKRPLTAFLWDEESTISQPPFDKKKEFTLPPLKPSSFQMY